MSKIRSVDRTVLVAIALLILASLFAFTGHITLYGNLNLVTIVSDFYANISSELASIAITVLIIDQLNQRREKREQLKRDRYFADEQRKRDQLLAIFELDRADTVETRQAIIRLMSKSNLFEGAKLSSINFTSVDLSFAKLNQTWLINCDFSRAKLFHAHINKADLTTAKFKDTNLQGASCLGSNLSFAVIENADLRNSNLSGANLLYVEISSSNLWNAILPDGAQYESNIELVRYTDPTHVDYGQTLEKINAIRRKLGIDPIEYLKS